MPSEIKALLVLLVAAGFLYRQHAEFVHCFRAVLQNQSWRLAFLMHLVLLPLNALSCPSYTSHWYLFQWLCKYCSGAALGFWWILLISSLLLYADTPAKLFVSRYKLSTYTVLGQMLYCFLDYHILYWKACVWFHLLLNGVECIVPVFRFLFDCIFVLDGEIVPHAWLVWQNRRIAEMHSLYV